MKADEKICERCGKSFTPRSNRQKFCSSQCRRRSDEILTCPVCGKTFHPFHKTVNGKRESTLYCSPECAFTDRKNSNPTKNNIEKTCPICGKIFSGTRSKFCSNQCKEKFDLQKRRKEATEKNLIEAKCQTCGKIFLVPKALLLKNPTCSIDCSQIYKRLGYRSDSAKIFELAESYAKQGKHLSFADALDFANNLKLKRVLKNAKLKHKRKSQLDENIRQANAAGLSYGKFMAMKNFATIY